MISKDNSPKDRSSTDIIKQFLIGIAFGLVLALIPLQYMSLSVIDLKLLHIIVLAALVLSCGVIAAIFGNKFLGWLMTFLDSIPPLS